MHDMRTTALDDPAVRLSVCLSVTWLHAALSLCSANTSKRIEVLLKTEAPQAQLKSTVLDGATDLPVGRGVEENFGH